MAQLAAALRDSRLDDGTFEHAAAIVEEMTRGRVGAHSVLHTAANVQRLNETARHLMMRDVRRGLLLARLASLIAPRVKCRTKAATVRMKRLTAEAFYLCASGHLRCRHCVEAKEAAERAMRAYRVKGVAEVTRKDQTIVDLAYGQIIFLRGEPERGLRIIARAAEEFLKRCDDLRLHGIALQTYGAMLYLKGSYRSALRIADRAMYYAMKIEDRVLMTGLLHNAALCAAQLGILGALPGRNLSRERLAQFGLDSEVPKSRYVTYVLLKREGKFNEAVSELYMIRQEFLDRDMPVVAAQSVVRIVRELVALRRYSEARFVGEDALRILTDAGVEFDAVALRALLGKCR
jgi:tetratricopeptide (TPR) repeat protein